MLQERGLNRACAAKAIDAISVARQLIQEAGLDTIANCHMSRLLPLVADLVSARDAQTEIASKLRIDLISAQAEIDNGVAGINRARDRISAATSLRGEGGNKSAARTIPITQVHGSNGPLPIDRALDDVASYSAGRRDEASWAAAEENAVLNGVVALGDMFAAPRGADFGTEAAADR